jgi:hypothetical protein
MAQIFPKSANRLPLLTVALAGFLLVGAVGGVWYYGSPQYTDVGYRPHQPVAYSHKLHAGDLGIDCRYCHTTVETSAKANVPPTSTCMNCHTIIKTESEKLTMIRSSYSDTIPMEWVKVHDLPDYAYFNHGVHVRAGVGCYSCHGNVAEMEEVTQVSSLSMGWCLDCHRNPDQHLRPVSEVTNMYYVPPADQAAFAAAQKAALNLNPPENCTACHR